MSSTSAEKRQSRCAAADNPRTGPSATAPTKTAVSSPLKRRPFADPMPIAAAAPMAISASELEDFAAGLLAAAGTSRDEAKIVAASLVDADLCGHESHGV